MRYRHVIGLALAVGGLLTVYGCGDSGGDDKPAPVAAAITASNADTVAPKASGQAVVGVDQISGLQEVTALASEQSDFTDPIACPVSGEISLTGSTRAFPDKLSSGDRFQAVFSDCVIALPSGGEVTLNSPEAGPAGMTVVITGVSNGLNGEPSVPGDTISLTATFANLALSNEDEDLKIDGSISVAESYAAAVRDPVSTDVITPEGLRTTIAAKSLTFTELNSDGTVEETLNFSGLTIDEIEEADTSIETITISGTMTSSELGGFMLLDTIIPFLAEDGAQPTEGALRISFARGATVLIDAESGGEPELWLDLNGDGKPELTGQAANPIPTTWADLGSAAY